MNLFFRVAFVSALTLLLSGCVNESIGALKGDTNHNFIEPQYISTSDSVDRMLIDKEQKIWTGYAPDSLELLHMNDQKPISVHNVYSNVFFILDEKGTGTYKDFQSSYTEKIEGIVKAQFNQERAMGTFLDGEGNVHVRTNPADTVANDDNTYTDLHQLETIENAVDIEVYEKFVVALTSNNQLIISEIERGENEGELEDTVFLSGKLPEKATNIAFNNYKVYVVNRSQELFYIDLLNDNYFPPVLDPDDRERKKLKEITEFPLKQTDITNVTSVKPYGEHDMLIVSDGQLFSHSHPPDSEILSFDIENSLEIQDVFYSEGSNDITVVTKDHTYHSVHLKNTVKDWKFEDQNPFIKIDPNENFKNKRKQMEDIVDPTKITRQLLLIHEEDGVANFSRLINDQETSDRLIQKAEDYFMHIDESMIKDVDWEYTYFGEEGLQVFVKIKFNKKSESPVIAIQYKEDIDGSLEVEDVTIP